VQSACGPVQGSVGNAPRTADSQGERLGLTSLAPDPQRYETPRTAVTI
jgi:hypothetical protein